MKALAYSVEKYRIFLQKITKEKDHMSRQHQNWVYNQKIHEFFWITVSNNNLGSKPEGVCFYNLLSYSSYAIKILFKDLYKFRSFQTKEKENRMSIVNQVRVIFAKKNRD